MYLKFKRVGGNTDMPLPSFQSPHSSGMDVCAHVTSDIVIKPGERSLIPTGFAVEIPVGYELQVRPRSGLAIKNGISLVNSPGTIDADYRGEIKIILVNHGQENFMIRNGDRIAQMVMAAVMRPEVIEVNELGETERGEGGFGSTGGVGEKSVEVLKSGPTKNL